MDSLGVQDKHLLEDFAQLQMIDMVQFIKNKVHSNVQHASGRAKCLKILEDVIEEVRK
jgi:hypothetical protein